MDKQKVFDLIDRMASTFTQASDRIWEYAELGFQEYRSSEELIGLLEKEGFRIEKGVGGLETAFRATYGSGAPRIALLGEYDALPELSQKADSFEKEADPQRTCGHGCGHHLLGAGSAAAAVAVKRHMETKKMAGTIEFYGCPAEENGSGKASMAKSGAFDGLDAALTWHPSSFNTVVGASTLANYKATFSFKGISSHAAMAPHMGRSALDALELMNVGANFLREHIIPEARLHYAITNTGGDAANVVQAEADVVYMVRAPRLEQVQEIYERLCEVARGAAIMTQTEYSVHLDKTCADLKSNKVLEQLLDENFQAASVPAPSSESLAYAQKMIDTMSAQNLAPVAMLGGRDLVATLREKPLHDAVLPYRPTNITMPASSDVGDVSWNAPTAQFATACYALGTSEHSWQMVAQGKHEIAHNGMLLAGKVLAGAALDLLENPELLARAKEGFEADLGGLSYKEFFKKQS